MSFRTFQWGKYPSQAADFEGRYMVGDSIINYGQSVDSSLTTQDMNVEFIIVNTTTEIKLPMIHITMLNMRAQLGQDPFILNSTFNIYRNSTRSQASSTKTYKTHRVIQRVDWKSILR